MSVHVISPDFVSATEWADFMVPNLEQYGNLGRLDDEKEWRTWGLQLLNLPALSGSIIPNPYDFDDWRAWARRCVENLAGVP